MFFTEYFLYLVKKKKLNMKVSVSPFPESSEPSSELTFLMPLILQKQTTTILGNRS